MNQTILIVDDEPDFVEMLAMHIRSAGYNVLTAPDGLTGLEKAHTENPDLIILDVMLPKINGNELCRTLKSDPKYRKLPIIILTARSQQQDKELAQSAGADAYLKKPCEYTILLDKIKELISIK